MGKRVAAVAAVWAAMALCAPEAALAKKMVYSPVAHEGEHELAWYVDSYSDGPTDVMNHELEFEYGIGPRDVIAVYAVYADRGSGSAQFQRYKLEWLRQLWEQGERAVDAGIYLEYQISDGVAAADKVEFKALLEKDLGRITLTGNGILEKELGQYAGAGTELGYAARAAYRASHNWTPAVEAFGGIGELRDVTPASRQSHLFGPALDVRVGPGVSLHVGALFGLTSGGENVRVKAQVAYEWY